MCVYSYIHALSGECPLKFEVLNLKRNLSGKYRYEYTHVSYEYTPPWSNFTPLIIWFIVLDYAWIRKRINHYVLHINFNESVIRLPWQRYPCKSQQKLWSQDVVVLHFQLQEPSTICSVHLENNSYIQWKLTDRWLSKLADIVESRIYLMQIILILKSSNLRYRLYLHPNLCWLR